MVVSIIVAEPKAKWRAARAPSFDSTVVVGTGRQRMAAGRPIASALHYYLSPILLVYILVSSDHVWERFSCADGWKVD
jgi:hypothetical protein